MIHVDEDCLKRFRGVKPCEHCKKVRTCDAAHWKARGMGGGSRIDRPWNLLSLCRECHDLAHWGKINPADLLALIAKREGMTPKQIQELIWTTLAEKKT